MEDCAVKPTLITLGCLSEVLARCGQVEEALKLIRAQLRCLERKACVNIVIHFVVIKGLVAARQIELAFTAYCGMRDLGIQCNTIT